MASCRTATYLMSKKEEQKLTATESIALAYHLSVCSLCRSFEKQTGFFSKRYHSVLSNERISEERKTEIKKNLEEIMRKG